MGAAASVEESKNSSTVPPQPLTLTDEELRDRMQNNSMVKEEDDLEVEVADIVSEMKGDRALEALKSTESSADEALQQIGIIIEIASKNKENKAMFRKRMAVEILLKVARNHQHSSPLIAINCIKALNLVMDGFHASIETENLMGTSGIIEIVMELFQKTPHNEAVIEQCCRLVRSLTNVGVNNLIRLGSLGCNELIVETLKIHPVHETINIEGWNCLTNLCRNTDNCMKMADAIDLLTPAMYMHSSNHLVVLACVRAVVNLSGPTALNSKLGESGACKAVVDAMTNTQSEVTKDASVRAIINLSSDNTNRKLLGEVGACEALCEAIKLFPENVTIVHGACVACLSLSNVPANKAKLTALGLRSVLEAIISKTPPDGIIFRLANML